MPKKILFIALLTVIVFTFIINAWICDDAYISFRVIDNAIHGYGLSWNTGERVQVFTHPLWLILLLPFQFISGEAYFTTIIVSLALIIGAVLLVRRITGPNQLAFVFLIAALISSQAFIDYSTSGLENPLAIFLSALFVYYMLFKDKLKETGKILYLTLIFSGLALTRLDLSLMFFPALAYEALKQRKSIKAAGLLKIFIIGLLPLILWHLFSLFYYGFLFPNSAYAKLGAGLTISDYFMRAFDYYSNSLFNAPLTLLLILGSLVIAIIISISGKDFRIISLSSGIFLYLLYILRIGGDFMSGRFFAVPFFLSLLIMLIQLKETKLFAKPASAYGISAIILCLGFFGNSHPIVHFNGFSDNSGTEQAKTYIDQNGISNEKEFYYAHTGLIPVLKKGNAGPDYLWVKQGRESKTSEINVMVRGVVGMFAYYAGPDKHIIDFYAVCDPLLSKLPVSDDPYEPVHKRRIGHFYRKMPVGYYETINSGSDKLIDKNISEYYHILKNIINGGLFSGERLSNIINLNFGAYDDLLPESNNYTEESRPYPYGGDSNSLVTYYFQMAKYSQYIGQTADIKINYGKALEFSKTKVDSMDVLEGLVYYLIEKKDFQAAATEYEKMLNVNSSDTIVIIPGRYIASGLFDAGNNVSAINIMRFLLKYHPQKPELYSDLGTYLYYAGKMEEAEKIWLQGIETAGNYPELLYKLYIFYYQNVKDYDKAYRFAEAYMGMGGQIAPAIWEELKKRNVTR